MKFLSLCWDASAKRLSQQCVGAVGDVCGHDSQGAEDPPHPPAGELLASTLQVEALWVFLWEGQPAMLGLVVGTGLGAN